MDIVPQLEKRTHYLATLANVATLLGLLGTVSGLIHAFAAVATVNPAEKANLLSASISEAMNCTAFGLMTAVPILVRARLSAVEDHGAERWPGDGGNPLPERARRAPGGPGPEPPGARAARRSRRPEDHPMRSLLMRRERKPAELLLVPMIDIFTVLVTFLLMTAVFSRIAIMQIDLPSSAAAKPEEPQFRLEVIVRQDGFELS